MRQHVPPQQLWNEFHGDMEFAYDHSVYWPALLKLAEERFSERRERWVKAGKQYGESEIYLRGGNASSVYQSSGNEVTPAVEKEDHPAESEETATEVTASEEKEVVVPTEDAPAAEESKAPAQTSGAQSNGNTDVAAVTPDPVLTTEGDKA